MSEIGLKNKDKGFFQFANPDGKLDKTLDGKKFFPVLNTKTNKIELRSNYGLSSSKWGELDASTGTWTPAKNLTAGPGSGLMPAEQLVEDKINSFMATDEAKQQLVNNAQTNSIKVLMQDGKSYDEAEAEVRDTINNSNASTDPNNADSTPITAPDVSRASLLDAKGRDRFPDLVYPLTRNLEQDFIKFAVREFKPRKFNNQTAGVLQERSRNALDKVSKGSVTLPMPAGGIRDSNNCDWGNAKLNPLEALAAQTTLAALGKEKGAVGSILGDIGKAAQGAGAVTASAALIAGAAAGSSAQQILQRTEGAVLNPNVELLFNAPQLRTFQFDFSLSPRSADEAGTIRQIIRLFKQAMAARRTERGVFLKAPLVFELSYINNQINLNRFKECALTTFNTNYTPNGAYSTYSDGTMTQYNISMTFSELDPIFNDDYDTLDDGQQDTAGIGF